MLKMADLINPIKEAWNVMLHPSRANTATGPSFYYRAVVIPGIINAIIAALLIAAFPSATFLGSLGPLFGFIVVLLIMFLGIPASVVIDSALVHLFGKLLFRIMKQPFNNTLTAISYAMSPAIFFYWTEALPAPANIVAIIIGIWTFVLEIFMLSKTQQVSKLRALGALLIPIIIFAVIIIVILLLPYFESFSPSYNGNVQFLNHPDGVAITPNGDYAYVANYYNNTVSVISTSTNTVVKTITVGTAPDGVAITPNGNYAYVTNYNSGTLSVIRT